MTTSENILSPRPDMEGPKQAPKKRHVGLIILAVLGGLLVISAISGAGESSTDTPTSVTSDTSYEVTAENVVDVMGDATVESFCDLYFQLGDYDLALASFTEGYGQGQDPSAEEVFDELLVRC
jgi:hypothetical protein